MKKYYSQRNNEIHPELSANDTSFMNSIANKTIEDWNELKIKIRDYDMTKKLKPKQKKCPKCNIPYKITFKGQYVVKYICHKCGYEKIYEGDINE